MLEGFLSCLAIPSCLFIFESGGLEPLSRRVELVDCKLQSCERVGTLICRISDERILRSLLIFCFVVRIAGRQVSSHQHCGSQLGGEGWTLGIQYSMLIFSILGMALLCPTICEILFYPLQREGKLVFQKGEEKLGTNHFWCHFSPVLILVPSLNLHLQIHHCSNSRPFREFWKASWLQSFHCRFRIQISVFTPVCLLPSYQIFIAIFISHPPCPWGFIFLKYPFSVILVLFQEGIVIDAC